MATTTPAPEAQVAAGSAVAAGSSSSASESMGADLTATWLLEQETRALLTRLASIRPFVLQEPYLAAAALSPAALSGIEQFLIAGRRDVRRRANAFLVCLGVRRISTW